MEMIMLEKYRALQAAIELLWVPRIAVVKDNYAHCKICHIQDYLEKQKEQLIMEA